MTERRWFQYPAVYFAILRHYLNGNDELVEIHGLTLEEAKVRRADFKTFLKKIIRAHDEEVQVLVPVAREMALDIQPSDAQEGDQVTLRLMMNELAIAAKRVSGELSLEPEPEPEPIKETPQSYDVNELEELMRKRREGMDAK